MELRHVDQSHAQRLLKRVLDAGINFIYTSPDYGPSVVRMVNPWQNMANAVTQLELDELRKPGEAPRAYSTKLRNRNISVHVVAMHL